TTATRPTEPEILPPAENYVGRLAVTLFEVLRGRRPLSTLARFVSPKIHGSLDRRRHRAGSTMKIKPVRLRTVVGSTPKNGTYDAAVILEEEGIIHTMALRITQNRGRWIVTELYLD
ncbi:Rv3235 family protein, partial [Dermatophilus congolensis]|uniref:Rv3235 family protein n=23 Tax=Dermatophilus congolensis TaxID=1863 RepID=UPI001FB9309C